MNKKTENGEQDAHTSVLTTFWGDKAIWMGLCFLFACLVGLIGLPVSLFISTQPLSLAWALLISAGVKLSLLHPAHGDWYLPSRAESPISVVPGWQWYALVAAWFWGKLLWAQLVRKEPMAPSKLPRGVDELITLAGYSAGCVFITWLMRLVIDP